MSAVEICHLYISVGHNFVGRHGREPETHPMIEVAVIECVAGRGIRGDRYFDFKERTTTKASSLFFSLDVLDKLCAALKLHDCSPAAARRNVITRGVDLNDLIGKEFEVQGVALFVDRRSAGRVIGWREYSRPARRSFSKGAAGYVRRF